MFCSFRPAASAGWHAGCLGHDACDAGRDAACLFCIFPAHVRTYRLWCDAGSDAVSPNQHWLEVSTHHH